MSSVEDAIKEFVEETIKGMDLEGVVEDAMPDVSKLVDSALEDVDWPYIVADAVKDEVREQIKGTDWSDVIGDLIHDEINENTDIVTADQLPKLITEHMGTEVYKAQCEALAIDRVDNLVTQPKFLTMLDMLATSRITHVMNSSEFNKGLENRIIRKLAEVTETEEFRLRLDVANRKSLGRVLSGLGRLLFLS